MEPESRRQKRERWSQSARERRAETLEDHQVAKSTTKPTRGFERFLWWTAGGLAALFALMVAGSAMTDSRSPSASSGSEQYEGVIAEAVGACSSFSSAMSHNRQARQVSVRGGEVEHFAAVNCLLGASGAPARVWQDIEQTNALQGNRSESWFGGTASWNYHPDRGIDFILER
ncbi:hypothetical protein [Nesterenkonia haasae]|uniref:hypothetical protein n=1 Tax=Nesterenkonia haasae TaxID=2587813 RepID=UPI0013918B06|nr:hypothetical protein [Nesterenkonia haasae]NDK31178.1 hypothetical protein [Nesterenkonia haasae]